MAENVAEIRRLLDQIKNEGLDWLSEPFMAAGSLIPNFTDEQKHRVHELTRRISAIQGRIANVLNASPSRDILGSVLAEFGLSIRGACNALWLRRFIGNQYEPISVVEAQQTFGNACQLAREVLSVATGEFHYVPPPGSPPSASTLSPTPAMATGKKKRGPAPAIQDHKKVAAIVGKHDGDWRKDDDLLDTICAELDSEHVPVPPHWKKWERRPHCWKRAAEYDRRNVVKAIEYRLNATAKHTS